MITEYRFDQIDGRVDEIEIDEDHEAEKYDFLEDEYMDRYYSEKYGDDY